MALIEIDNLTKVFPVGEFIFGGGARGEVRAVDDVSLAIEPGETLGLVGESGSGKSTLGRLVLRLIEPTSGSVRFEGRDLLNLGHGEMRRVRRDMQIIFQDPFSSLDPRMRVEDLIAEPLIIHKTEAAPSFPSFGKSGTRTLVEQLLRAVGLDQSAMRRFPHEFSGDRPCPGIAPKIHSLRRTRLRARRKRRRANRESAGAIAARLRPDLPVHLALDAGCALSFDTNRGHVSRQNCRGQFH